MFFLTNYSANRWVCQYFLLNHKFLRKAQSAAVPPRALARTFWFLCSLSRKRNPKISACGVRLFYHKSKTLAQKCPSISASLPGKDAEQRQLPRYAAPFVYGSCVFTIKLCDFVSRRGFFNHEAKYLLTRVLLRGVSLAYLVQGKPASLRPAALV